jgi:hypothetical protein
MQEMEHLTLGKGPKLISRPCRVHIGHRSFHLPHGSNGETFMKSTLLEMGLKSLRRMVVYQGFI